MNQQNQSPLDSEPFVSEIKELIFQGESNTSIAIKIQEDYGLLTTKDSIRRFRQRHKLSIPTADKTSFAVEGDDATLTTATKPYPHMDDPDKMLEERGLSPEDWIIQGATVNEWDGPQAGGSVVTYHQAKIQLKRKRPELQILPARSDGWTPPIKCADLDKPTELIVVVGDQQAPFHDPELHAAFCAWLEANEPDRGISLGDTIDLPDISRHRLDPENTATVNECIQSGHDLLKDYVGSSPVTLWQKLAGNHDERLRNILLDKPSVQPLYGLKQADSAEEEGQIAMSVRFLLRLDELGIKFVDPQGAYDLGQINLNTNLAVRHGWIARQGSGASALATLEHLGYSVIVGHTHRQSLVYKTTHDIDGKITTLSAAEAGCMCRVNQQPQGGRKWPNFTPLPDWQQGFSTVTVHPDTGFFRIEHATFVNGTLLWREQCYSA
jgi:hypothetical protein